MYIQDEWLRGNFEETVNMYVHRENVDLELFSLCITKLSGK